MTAIASPPRRRPANASAARNSACGKARSLGQCTHQDEQRNDRQRVVGELVVGVGLHVGEERRPARLVHEAERTDDQHRQTDRHAQRDQQQHGAEADERQSEPAHGCPRSCLTAVAKATKVSRTISAAREGNGRPDGELQQHGGLAAAIMLIGSVDQADRQEAHGGGVDEVPEGIDQLVAARRQPVRERIDQDVAAPRLRVGQEGEDGDGRTHADQLEVAIDGGIEEAAADHADHHQSGHGQQTAGRRARQSRPTAARQTARVRRAAVARSHRLIGSPQLNPPQLTLCWRDTPMRLFADGGSPRADGARGDQIVRPCRTWPPGRGPARAACCRRGPCP